MKRNMQKALSLFLALAMLTGLIGTIPAQAAETKGRGEGENALITENKITIDPTDYGADPSGKGDSALAIWNAFEAAKEIQGREGNQNKAIVIDFPKGEYHIYKDYAQQREYHTSNTDSIQNPIKWNAILIENQRNFTMEGNGSMFILHGDMMAVSVVKSENVTLRNFSWDFGVPTTAEMTVKAHGTESGNAYTDYYIPSSTRYSITDNTLVWESERSPYTGEPYWTMGATSGWTRVSYDPETKIHVRDGFNPFAGASSIKQVGENTLRVYSSQRPKVGKMYAVCNTPLRTSAGAFNWESKDIVVDGVNGHYLHAFGWLTQMCENVTYKNCNFTPRDGTGHLTTGYADIIHVSGAKGKITVEGCNFSFPQDDHINIHGTFTVVDQRVNDTTLKLSYKQAQQGGFPQYHVGDKVVFATRNGLLPMGGAGEEEVVYTVVSATDPFADNGGGKTMTVVFDKALPSELSAANTYVAENLTYTPEVLLKGNYFGTLDTRSVLCTTRKKVVMEDNVFVGSTMQPIFLSNDSYDWYESGPIKDLTIKNNTFYTRYAGDTSMRAVIGIQPVCGSLPSVDSPIHHNITIEGNTFYTEGKDNVRAVEALSVGNLVIKNNQFHRWNPNLALTLSGGGQTLAPGVTTQLNLNAAGQTNNVELFSLRNCNGVTIEGNTYDNGQKLKISNDGSKNITNKDADKGLSETNNTLSPVADGCVYLSSNPEVATVNAQGLVTAVSAGTADITACYQWNGSLIRSNTVAVTVAGASVDKGTRLQIGNVGEITLTAVNETRSLTAITEPAGTAVAWSVVNAATGAATDCATIVDGTLTAKKSGLVTVKAAAGGLMAEQTFAIAIPTVVPAAGVSIANSAYGATNGENKTDWSGNAANGSVTIRTRDGDLYGSGNKDGTGVKNMFLCALPADAANDLLTAVKITGLPARVNNAWDTVSFLLLKDVNNYASFGKKSHYDGFATVNEIASACTETRGNVAQNGSTAAWFAFHKSSAATIDVYFKVEGGAWTKQSSLTNGSLGESYKIALATWGGNGAPTYSDFHAAKASTLTGATTVDKLNALMATDVIPFVKNQAGPSVSNVALDKSSYMVGDTAHVSYTYTAGATAEAGSVYEWTLSNDSGLNKARTNQKDYVIPAAGTLTCTVYPVDASGVPGTPSVTSSAQVTGTVAESLRLKQLEVMGGIMSAFNPDTTAYTVTLPGTADFIRLNYESENAATGTTTIRVGNGSDAAKSNSGFAVLAVEDGMVINLTRTKAGESKTYTLTVRLAKSGDTALSALSLGDLVAATGTVDANYTVTAENGVLEAALSATAADPAATITVTAGYNFRPVTNTSNGNKFSATVPLRSGLNSFFITVTAADGHATKETMIHVLRSGYTDTTLEGLSVGGAPLQGFSAETRDYDMTVDAQAVSLAIAATSAAGKRQAVSITAGGIRTEKANCTVPLKSGMNNIIVAVKADNLVTNGYYTIHAYKPYDSNTNLKTFTLNGVTLTPLFSNDVKNYTATATGTEIPISIQSEDNRAAIAVTCGSQTLNSLGGTVTGRLALHTGVNTITVAVTAADSTTDTYTVTMTVVGEIYLSDLTWKSASAGYLTVQKDKNVKGGPIKLTGADGAAVTYAKGFGTHAASEIVYDVTDDGYRSFSAKVGMEYSLTSEEDASKANADSNFKVYLDDVEVYASGEMKYNTPQKEILVSLTPFTKSVRLVVEEGDNNWSDWANWADAKFTSETVPEDAQKYAVAVDSEITNGTVSVDRSSAPEGGWVVVTANPEAGCRLKAGTLKAHKTGAPETAVALTDGKWFAMPAYGVTVTAQFEKTPELAESTREHLNFNQGWKFTRGEVRAATAVDFPMEELELWEGVNLPHTVRLEGVNYSGNTNYQGKAMYRKHFYVPADYAGQKLYLNFEGAMGVSDVWVNGTHVQSPIAAKTGSNTQYGGYLPFILDITNLVTTGGNPSTGEGYNVVTVMVDNSDNGLVPPGKPQGGLDYTYMGGIYRNVWLDAVSPVHITDPNYEDIVAGGGVLAYYTDVSAQAATVNVKTHVRNEDAAARAVVVETQLIDRDGNVVGTALSDGVTINEGGEHSYEQSMVIQNPNLWNVNTPYLYTLVSTVKVGAAVVDRTTTTLGIRTIAVSKTGVLINGADPGFLSGVNRHQDYPYIGFAASSSLQRRDAVKFKEAGFNIVRTSHAPHSIDFINACDELGILVIESLNGWQYWNNNPVFGRRVQSDAQQIVRRTRNHPSIFAYEMSLNESPGVSVDFTNSLTTLAKAESPMVITSAENLHRGANADILYGTPSEVANISTESASLIREYADLWEEQFSGDFSNVCRVTRGPGDDPDKDIYPGGEAQMVDQANNALWRGFHFVGAGNLSLAGGLKHFDNTGHRFISAIKWIGIDHNRGYHKSMSPCGVWDLMRIPKYMYYAYASQRPIEKDTYLESKGLESGPAIFIASSWSAKAPVYDKGGNKGTLGTDNARTIYVYSNAAKVKLSVIGADGQELWTRINTPTTEGDATYLDHAPFDFQNVPYTAGSYLKAEGLDGSGISIAGMTQELHTAGAPAKLRLVADYENTALVADGSDAVMIYAYVEDANGTLCQTATDLISFSVEGPASIIGEGNLRVGANPVKAEAGIIGVYIQSAKEAGSITVTAKAKGLTDGTVSFTSSELTQKTVPYIQIADNGQGDIGSVALAQAQGIVVGENPNNAGFATGSRIVGGDAYPNSIEVRNMAVIEYDLTTTPGFTRLVGKAALKEPAKYQDGTVFKVYADGVLRYASPRVTTGVRDIDVDITGVEKLTLVGEDANGLNTSNVLWLTPTLVKGNPTLPDDSELRQNLAAGKHATATSSKADSAPGLALDGNKATGWYSGEAVASGTPQSLTVDLGANLDLRNAKVALAHDYFKYTYTISVAADSNGPWTEKITTSKTAHASEELDLFTAKNVRYIRVEFTKIESAQGGGDPSALIADITELEFYKDLGVASVDEFNLKGLEVAGNDMVLNPAVTEWTVTPQGTDGKIYLRVLPADPTATVAVNGAVLVGLNKTDLRDVPFSACDLDADHQVKITVTAASGAAKTYTLTASEPASVHTATAALVPGVNGANGWAYRYLTGDTAQNITGAGTYAAGEYVWKQADWVYSGPRFLHPDASAENWVTRAYTAPKVGTLHLSADAELYAGQTGSVRFVVLKNGTKIWPTDAAYKELAAGGHLDIELDAAVAKGDVIEIAMNSGTGNGGDATCVVSTVHYQGDVTPNHFTVQGPAKVTGIGMDAVTQSYSLEAKAGDTPVPGYPCAWKLEKDVTGASINTDGILTFAANVKRATVTVQAIEEGETAAVLASKEVTFTRVNNVALGKTATADATGDPSNPPAKAVDGNTEKPSLWHPGGVGPNHWWKVDLGGTYHINEVTIHFGWDQGLVRHKFDLQSSMDGENWTTVKSYSDYNGTASGVVTLSGLDFNAKQLKVSNLCALKAGHEEWVEIAELIALGDEPRYTVVTAENLPHGTLTADQPSAQAGETVTVTAHPAIGYQIKEGSLKVYRTGAESDTVEVVGLTFVMPDYDVTVTAEFEIGAGYYMVTLPTGTGYTVRGTGEPIKEGGSDTFTLTVDEGYTQSIPTVKANDVVLGAVSVEGAVYTYTIADITKNQTVTIEGLVRNRYAVTFRADGHVVETKQVEHGATLTRGEFPTLPVKPGYTGVWAGTEDLTNIISSQTVDAVYTAKNYTVTLNVNGGAAWENEGGTLAVTYGEAYGELPEPTYGSDAKVFAGWFTAAENGEKVLGTTTVTATEDHTLYAHWHDANTSASPDAAVTGMESVTLPYKGKGIELSATEGSSYTYQWQQKIGEDWTYMKSETARTYTVPAAEILALNSGRQYRCEITNTEENKLPAKAFTAAVTLVVEKGRQEAPRALTGQMPTAADKNDCTITGLDVSRRYEYKLENGVEYQKVAEGSEMITGLAPGTYLVRFAESDDYLPSDGRQVTAPIFVVGVVRVTGVTLDRTSLPLHSNRAPSGAQLVATVAPVDATDKTLTWTTSDSEVATVADGLVTAHANGTATITVTTTDGGFKAECVVTVSTYTEPYDPPSNTTTTEKNKDGSITKTVTNKTTGTVTKTTTMPNGDKTVVETKKDGTVTEKVINQDGYQSETVIKPDGSFTSKVTDQNGVKTETTATSAGETTAKVTMPKDKKSAKVTVLSKNVTPGTVAVIIHADGTEEIVKTGVVTADGVILTLKGDAQLKLIDNSKSFEDVDQDAWYSDFVQFAASHELLQGTSAKKFYPTGNMTRGMLVTVLARLDGQDTAGGETWYSKAVAWGKETGITDGSNVEANITRESLVVMLYRYAKVKHVGGMALEGFSDAGSVSDWAAEAMAWAVANGILVGNDGKLNPSATASRAEVAAILQRFISM